MSKGLKQLVRRAQEDRQFLYRLIDDPVSIVGDFELNEREIEALVASNTPARLGSLVDSNILAAGCGSSGTCTSTCTATCTVTFTSIASPEGQVAG